MRRYGRRAALMGAAALAVGLGATILEGTEAARAARPPVPPLEVLVGSGDGPTEPPFAARAVEALASAFRSQEPAAHIHVTVAPRSLLHSASALLRGQGAAADLMLVPPAVRDLPDAGVLMHNLTPTMRAAGVGAGVYPSLLTYCSEEDRLLAAPLFRDPLVVYYNVDAFSRAGVPPLPGQWTLDGFMGVCRALAARTADPVRHALANAVGTFDAELVGMFIAGFGGRLDAAHLYGLSSPSGLHGIQALLALRGFEPERPASSPRDLFASGGAAMYFGHQRDMPYISTAVGDLFAWNVAPVPRLPERAATPVQAQGLAAVTPRPGRRAEATALALFALTTQAQTAAAPVGAGVPSLQTLADSPLWRAAMSGVALDVFVQRPEADLVIPPAMSSLPPLRLALQRSLRGIPVAEAVAAARAALAPPGA